MSLSVYINYKEPKVVNYNDTHACCGSNIPLVPDGYLKDEYWSANITHNMGKMASAIKLSYYNKASNTWEETTLYQVVWRPEEQGFTTTDDIVKLLKEGICHMIEDRLDLLQFNPENGWGSYDSFLKWLIKYKEACEDNLGCTIEVSR